MTAGTLPRVDGMRVLVYRQLRQLHVNLVQFLGELVPAQVVRHDHATVGSCWYAGTTA